MLVLLYIELQPATLNKMRVHIHPRTCMLAPNSNTDFFFSPDNLQSYVMIESNTNIKQISNTINSIILNFCF